MKLVERALLVGCCIWLASCGGQENQVPLGGAVGFVEQTTEIPNKHVLVLGGEIELTYPAYAYSGQAYELSAKPLAAQSSYKTVRWLKKRNQNFGIANTASFQGVHWTETRTDYKYSGFHTSETPHIRSYKLEVEDDSGVRLSQQIDIPVYEHMQLGSALTARAGSTVDLAMSFDTQFTTDISGPFVTYQWQVEAGSGADLMMADQAKAQLTLPSVNEIQKFILSGRARTALGDVTHVSHKTIYAVPADQWVEATHLHITDSLKVVLRADGSMISLRPNEVEDVVLDIDPTQVKQLSGGFHYVVAVFTDGTARTLYPARYVEDRPYDGLSNIAALYGSQSSHDYAGRFRADYVTLDGDWFHYNDVEQSSTLEAQGINKLSSNSFRGLVLMRDGSLLEGETQVASNVKDASYSAYLHDDNRVKNVSTDMPEEFFPTDVTYQQVIGGNDACPEATFAINQQGVVSAFVPDALPFSPDFRNVQTFEYSCEIGLGIDNEGTAILYEGKLKDISETLKSIFSGDIPNPMNIK